MTRKLKDLVEEWMDEKHHFERISVRFLASVEIFSKLNAEIYKRCQKEGIDIKTLNLNE